MNVLSITATGNEAEKSFVIVKEYSDGTKDTYQTNEMSEQEFEECDYNTENDWKNFLNTSGNYYHI